MFGSLAKTSRPAAKNVAVVQRFDQRIVIDDVTAGYVGDDCARPQRANVRMIERAFELW